MGNPRSAPDCSGDTTSQANSKSPFVPKWRIDSDKVLYEEIMMDNDNLESNLLTSSLFKICNLYKLSWRFQDVKWG